MIRVVREFGNVCTSVPATIVDSSSSLVYQVSWLRAKAHLACWLEELRLVELEMGWTVNWFWWKEGEWKKRLGDLVDEERSPGLDCYCHKQMALWDSLADQAQGKFSKLLGHPLSW